MNKRSSKKIPAHYGMPDYYKFFSEQYPDIKIAKSKFNKIISEFNLIIGDFLIENLSYDLPYRLGKLEILKVLRKPYLDSNGKLVNNLPINWKATNELWEKNSEAKDKKILIRYNNTKTGGYVFSIKYNKKPAIYKNKSVYFFKPVRHLSRGIKDRIEDYTKDKYDTYIKYNNHVQRKDNKL